MKLMIELEDDERVVVKNWRDFLIHKLDILFASHEHCDLELVFQDGKTIKVSSSVLPYFL